MAGRVTAGAAGCCCGIAPFMANIKNSIVKNTSFCNNFESMATEDDRNLVPAPRLIEVLLPLPLQPRFTYLVPGDTPMPAIGCRVVVPLGSRKFYTGIVTGYPLAYDADCGLREIASYHIDPSPVVLNPQLKLWEWMADYYLCSQGEVYKAAVPSALRIDSETVLQLSPEYAELAPGHNFTPMQAAIVQELQHKEQVRVSALEALHDGEPGFKAAVEGLVEASLAVVSEKLTERYTASRVTMVKATFDYNSPAQLQDAFAKLSSARQTTLMQSFIQLSRGLVQASRPGVCPAVSRKMLLEQSGCSAAILAALVKKGVLEEEKTVVNRFDHDGTPVEPLPVLSAEQLKALRGVGEAMKQHRVTLLHGVTSSGKTEVYLHLITEALATGRNVLYLVPEIALTTQLTKRLRRYLGDKVLVYHSKFSDSERADIWKKLIASHSPMVVLGARSAVLLPFPNLGLVVVDEEHEQSFKQFDPAPRYNARDVAVVLAGMHGAKVLLGSATPSVETFYKARTGKFGLVQLLTRYGDVPLPAIKVIDVTAERGRGNMRGPLSGTVLKYTRESLEAGHQAIFFQPRRGYSPLARCRQCAWTPRCERCDVALTYHRRDGMLVCHYCGSSRPLPTVCPQCHEPAIETLGFGTERIEDVVEESFPGQRVSRLDLDTTRNKTGYERIIADFSSGASNILVGTQMVTKGLDFAGVNVVNVVNADQLLCLPDFRAAERAYNTLEQVSGRAGRRDGKGTVLIQSANPTHPLFGFLRNHNYEGFYRHELAERQQYFYPPFTRVIYMYIRHRDRNTAVEASRLIAQRLRESFGARVYGPDRPPVERINLWYIRRIMLKVEADASMAHVKQLLRHAYIEVMSSPGFKSLNVYYDVDPG